VGGIKYKMNVGWASAVSSGFDGELSRTACRIAGSENQTILNILGNFPLAAPESDAIEQFLKPIYRQIPQEAMAIALQ